MKTLLSWSFAASVCGSVCAAAYLVAFIGERWLGLATPHGILLGPTLLLAASIVVRRSRSSMPDEATAVPSHAPDSDRSRGQVHSPVLVGFALFDEPESSGDGEARRTS